MKRELVNGIMKEFWVIFNQEWPANIRNCSGTPNSTSSSVSQNKEETGNEPNKDNRGQKRQRDNDEGDEDFDGDGKRDPLSIDSGAAPQTLTADNSQQQQSPKTPPPAAENSTEMPSYLPLSLEETRMQTYELPNIPVTELTKDQSFDTAFENFDFEKWMPSIGEGAIQEEQWSQWINIVEPKTRREDKAAAMEGL